VPTSSPFAPSSSPFVQGLLFVPTSSQVVPTSSPFVQGLLFVPTSSPFVQGITFAAPTMAASPDLLVGDGQVSSFVGSKVRVPVY